MAIVKAPMQVRNGTFIMWLLLLMLIESSCTSDNCIAQTEPTKHCKECLNEDCLHCETGYYGKLCENKCSNCLLNTTCEKENGVCTNCTAGYSGKFCNTKCDKRCRTCSQLNSTQCLTYPDDKSRCNCGGQSHNSVISCDESCDNSDCKDCTTEPQRTLSAAKVTLPFDIRLTGLVAIPIALLAVIVYLIHKIRRHSLSRTRSNPGSLRYDDLRCTQTEEQLPR